MHSPDRPLQTITVGLSGADVTGATGAAIQIAIDALACRGGGTVRVLPGEYVLANRIRLRPNIRLIGEREQTILKRQGPVAWSDLATDADIGQTQITPTHPDRFRPGMGVLTWDKQLQWNSDNPPLTITHREGGDLHLDDYLTGDRRAEHGGRVIHHFHMILGREAPNVCVEGFTIDARVDDPEGVVGTMRSAAVYLYRCPDSALRDLTVINAPGDGICIGKTSLRTVIEDCEAAHNGYYGIHTGSHSARAAVRRCHIHHNASDGLYICWGIHHGEFVDNEIHDNGIRDLRSGLSIGHKDTDNLIARNRIRRNRKFGICFRAKTEANGAHRNVLRNNVIEDNGSGPNELAEFKKQLEPWETVGCGIHISPVTKDLVLENNTIRETRQGEERTQRHGIWTMPGVSNITLRGNTISGHPGGDIRDDAGAIRA
jgi:hypothetical protein